VTFSALRLLEEVLGLWVSWGIIRAQGKFVGVVVRTAFRGLCCGTLLVFYFLWLKKYQDGDGIVWPDGLEHHQQFDTAYATAALVVMLPEFSGAAAQLSPWLHVKCSGEKTHNIL
jgi:hypothetical protein